MMRGLSSGLHMHTHQHIHTGTCVQRKGLSRVWLISSVVAWNRGVWNAERMESNLCAEDLGGLFCGQGESAMEVWAAELSRMRFAGEVPTEQSLVPQSLEKGWRHANTELFSHL